ncbi:MAG: hypothetical protein JWM91_1237 [Rhodospirillales bacterium]|nr:hypothetical protein [Rhodospirillales bacterium]
MIKGYMILSSALAALVIYPVRAAPPLSATGCGLSVSSIVQDASAWVYCLDPSVPKSDWDNWSLASAGKVLYPGNPVAIQASRAWTDQIAWDLLHGASHIGEVFDTGSWSITRDATRYSGGNPAFVNSAFGALTNVGPNAQSSEWAVLGRVHNSSVASQAVGVYGQGNGYAAGSVWGLVGEAYAHVSGGTAVGLEIDSGGVAGTNAVGVDIVNTGNMKAAVRVQPGTPALVSAKDPGTFIQFNALGGIEFWVRGNIVQKFQ